MKLILEVLTAYIITLVLTGGSILTPLRGWIVARSPWLQLGEANHFIFCRLCVGFWASLLVAFCYTDLPNALVIYGGSYFLATQERS